MTGTAVHIAWVDRGVTFGSTPPTCAANSEVRGFADVSEVRGGAGVTESGGGAVSYGDTGVSKGGGGAV